MGSTITRDPNAFARNLFAGLPDRYDTLAEVLSFGQNRRWRRAMVDRAVAAGPQTVCDVATGTAGVALELRARGVAEVVGVDLSAAMLARGRANLDAAADDATHLVCAPAERLPFADATFDALTFTYLLRYVADPAATLAELVRVVRPGGVIASLDFFVPPKAGWRWSWRAYTRAVLPVAGVLTGGRPWGRVGTFLGPNIEQHYARYPLPWLVQAWRDAGVGQVGAAPMSLGGGLVMWGTRR